jgi:ubiquitin carboxyl-terminal hydrolase 35/38
MTVKQNITDFVEYNTDTSIENILSLMELFRQNSDILPQGDELLAICRSIVIKLGGLVMPSVVGPLRQARADIETVGGFLAEIANLNRNDYNPIVFACLTTLQQLLSQENRPSSAVTIVLRVVEDQSITKAVDCLLTHINDDESVKRAVIALCYYLSNLNFAPKLNAWIMDILDGLRQQNKFELLLNIAVESIERLTLALIIPYHRPHVAPVVYLMLLSVKHTPAVFNKVNKKWRRVDLSKH